MALGVTLKLSEDFFKRRAEYFRDASIEGTFNERITALKEKMTAKSPQKPTVVILGAGPAGLMRAIQSMSNGNPTKVIEKRPDNSNGRLNTVALTEDTIVMLKYCGIYQYLVEQKLIYPPNSGKYICVRLTDLEQAMKAVLAALMDGQQVISYGSQVTHLGYENKQIALTIASTDGQVSFIPNIDILINAEGSHSHTNTLLANQRVQVLPPIPVIAALYSDRRERITNISSFFRYVKTTVAYVAITIYYHVQFFFKFLFSSHFRSHFKGALILKTPNQTYLGCALSDEINQRLRSYEEAIQTQKQILNMAPEQEKSKHQKELQNRQAEYKSFATKWIHLSFCVANLASLILRFKRQRTNQYLAMGGHLSLDGFRIIQIAADRASEFCMQKGTTAVLMAGDAAATVDPTTGLGCNTAIQSSIAYLDFLWDRDNHVPTDQLLSEYSTRITKIVSFIHTESINARNLYRPDALHVTMLRQDMRM